MTDHYTVLDIPRDAGADTIVRAWRKAAWRYHPDKQGDMGVMESIDDYRKRLDSSAEKFRAARDAYTCLTDREQRAKHDATLSGAADAGLLSEDDFGLAQAGGSPVVDGNCLMCANSGEVRVAASGFWTRRKCPACNGCS